MNCKKSPIILPVTCHGLENFPSLIHSSSYPFVNFPNPMSLLFLKFESFVNGWMQIGKNWLNNFIFHWSFLNKLSPYHTPSLHIHLWIFETLWVLFLEFESFVKCKIWIVKKSHNNFTCHLSWLRNLCPFIHIPSYPFVNLKNPTSFFSWVWVIHKMLNMNCKKQISQQFYLSLIIP